jgi:hypothetical protein
MPETVGFTGTRSIRDCDLERIRAIVLGLPPGTTIVTGACIGVDAIVARIAHSPRYRVHTIVPANRSRVDPYWRKHCDVSEEMALGTDYRARNERIVELSDRLIAIAEYPEDHHRAQRSGTWQTVRIARRAGKTVEVHILNE